MSFRVEATEDARKQLAETTRWLTENAPSKHRHLVTELLEVERHLSRLPHLGTHYPRRPGVLRTLLRRSQIWVFDRVQTAKRTVRVVAFWHTSRGKRPPL